jgi:hypothetical protein
MIILWYFKESSSNINNVYIIVIFLKRQVVSDKENSLRIIDREQIAQVLDLNAARGDIERAFRLYSACELHW